MKPVTETFVFRIMLGILIFCPLAFGTVETWSLLIMEAGIFSSLLLFIFFVDRTDMRKAPGLVPLAALLCYMLFQAVPLPPEVIEKLSPATFELYRQSVWTAEPGAWSTLSLYPKGTVTEFLRFSSYAAAYLLTTHFLSDSRRLRRVVELLALFAAALAFFSIIQHLASNGKIYWVRELTQGGTPFGPYVNRNHFAGLMGMLFPLVMVLFLLSRPSSREESLRKKVSDLIDRSFNTIHLVLGFGAIIVALAIFLSLSRGGILSLFVSLSLIGFFLSRKIGSQKGRLLFIATVIVILYAVGWFGWTPVFERFRGIRTPEGEISELRLDIWKDSIGIVRDFPLTGTGAGSFMQVYPAYRTVRGEGIADHAHNDHLELLTDGGLIGAGLFAWFIAAVLVRSYRAFLKRTDRYARHLFVGALAGVTAFLLHGITDFNLYIGANGLYLFLLLGLLVNAAHMPAVGEEPLPAAGRRPMRRPIVWSAIGLLLLSVLFNIGQILGSVLQSEASAISLRKTSADTFSYYRDTLARASFLDPLEPSHHYLAGRAAAGHTDGLSARRSCLNAVRLSPSNAGYLQALGSALDKAGDTRSAEKIYAAGLARAKTNPAVIRQYGSFLLSVGKKEDALRQFMNALALEPQKIREYTASLALEGLSDADISGIIPETAESYISFAEYLDATGSRERALSAYEKAAVQLRRDRPESPGIYWRISQFAARRSRIEEALSVLQSAGERFPKDIAILLAMAGYYERSGLTDQASAAYRKILGLDPENKRAKKRLQEITGETAPKP